VSTGPTKNVRKTSRSDGCGHFVATGVVSAFFLVINGVLVTSLYTWLAPLGPPILSHTRAAAVIAIVGPLLLVFVEWWLIDWLVDVISPRDRTFIKDRIAARERLSAKPRPRARGS
jgi:hypothetical protein